MKGTFIYNYIYVLTNFSVGARIPSVFNFTEGEMIMLKKKISHILSFLSMLIVAAIVITSLPVNVLANDANGTISTAKNPEEEIKFDSGSVVESPATDFEYTIEDSKVTITKYIGSATRIEKRLLAIQ